LEINQDKNDETVNWLFEHGETYVLDHPELLSAVPPSLPQNSNETPKKS